MSRMMINAVAFCIVIILSGTNCKPQKKFSSPAGYDLNAPMIIELPHKVDQISGITYFKEDSSVFAIDDDNGNLYKIPLYKDPDIQHWEFGKGKDYEDVVLAGDTFYVLNSSGQVVSFPFTFPIPHPEKATLDINGKNEFETLFYQPALKKLIMLCKDCDIDEEQRNSAFAYDPLSNTFQEKPVMALVKKDIEKKLGKKISKFKPSAANVNPVTGDIFIVSSVNKLLVIASPGFSVKEVYEIDPSLFGQPEGLCFTSAGDLVISNEAANGKAANCLFFKRKRN